MKELLTSIEDLKKTKVKSLINKRIKEFEDFKRDPDELFKELCFCILTANTNAEKSIEIQNKINNYFLTLTEHELAMKLRQLSYRFPETRAKYIIEAKKHKDYLKTIVDSFSNEIELREWLVKNIKGLGYKEASHFLRNIGYKNLAIIDFHILDLLEKNKLIKKPPILTKQDYLKIENLLKNIAEKSNLNLAELDLYLWFAETGKILK